MVGAIQKLQRHGHTENSHTENRLRANWLRANWGAATGKLWLLALAQLLQVLSPYSVMADSPEPPATAPGFAHLLTSRTRETFEAIRTYVQNHPNSGDSLPAALWTLETAREFGWEGEAQETAAWVLTQSNIDAESRRSAQLVTGLADARQGNVAGAKAAFGDFLATLRLRQPNVAAEGAQSLALAWQLRGDLAAARDVYEQLRGGFFLSDEIRQFTESRSARLALVGQPAPSFSEPDLAGKPVSWPDSAGKVMLIDFWATNCRPCLEELPRLKRRQAEFAARGVEFLGVSFDDDAATVEQFQMSQGMTWRQVLGRATAEQSYHVALIPCLMLVDRAGKVAAVDVRPADLRMALQGVLARKAP